MVSSSLIRLLFFLFGWSLSFFYIYQIPFNFSQNTYIDENSAHQDGLRIASEIGWDQVAELQTKIERKSTQELFQFIKDLGFDARINNDIIEAEQVVMIDLIIRAPRGEGTESLILVVEYSEKVAYSISSVPIMLSFMRETQNMDWLDKDIVLLIVSPISLHEATLEIWLNKYASSRIALALGAFYFDINTFKIPTHLNIIHHGLNGLLPNMDLFSPMIDLAVRMDFPLSSIQGPFKMSKHSGLFNTLFTMLFGPFGKHTPLLKRGINSVTLSWSFIKASKEMIDDGLVSNYGFSSKKEAINLFLQIVQSSLRCVNNIHEELHHSHFFYIMVSWRRFLSMSRYTNVFILLLIPIVLCCLFWIYQLSQIPKLKFLYEDVSQMTCNLFSRWIMRCFSSWLVNCFLSFVLFIYHKVYGVYFFLFVLLISWMINCRLFRWQEMMLPKEFHGSSFILQKLIHALCCNSFLVIFLVTDFAAAFWCLLWLNLVYVPVDMTYSHVRNCSFAMKLFFCIRIVLHLLLVCVPTPILLFYFGDINITVHVSALIFAVIIPNYLVTVQHLFTNIMFSVSKATSIESINVKKLQ